MKLSFTAVTAAALFLLDSTNAVAISAQNTTLSISSAVQSNSTISTDSAQTNVNFDSSKPTGFASSTTSLSGSSSAKFLNSTVSTSSSTVQVLLGDNTPIPTKAQVPSQGKAASGSKTSGKAKATATSKISNDSAKGNSKNSQAGNGQSANGSNSGKGTQVSNGQSPMVTIFTTVTAQLCAPTAKSGLSGTSKGGSSGLSGTSKGGSSGSTGSSKGGSGSGFSSSGKYPTGNSTKSSSSLTGGATLLPAVHWDHPVNKLENLKPADNQSLYYATNGVADPNSKHDFASLSTTLQYPAVILDHSSFVKSTTCSGNGSSIKVTFTSKEAFEYAATAWAKSSDFVLVTYAQGCGLSADQRTFWLINGITADPSSNSITANVRKEIPIDKALDAVDLAWGTYYPPGTSQTGVPFGGTTGSGSTGNSSALFPGGSGNSTRPGSNSASPGGSKNSTTNNGSACGAAPAKTIDGFPAAACGAADFDKQLDDALGYFDMNNPADYGDDVKDFVPNVSFDGDDLVDDNADGDLRRRAIAMRHLQKRGFWSWIKKAVSTVVKVAVKVATAPLQIAAAAVKAIPVVGNFIAKATEFNPSVSGTTDIKLGPSNSATSPWGEAALIYQKASSKGDNQADVALYCVDCGIKGHVTIAGVAKWNLLDGLKALNANMKANMEAGLNLGLVAAAIFSETKTKPIINQAIPNLGMSVKGIFSAGVFVGVDAVAKMNIKAQGQALVGVTMVWPNFEATMDLIGDGSKVVGYEPQFKKRFEASGTIAADARLSLPVSFNVGLEIIPINWKKAISLIEEPSLFGNITFAGSTPGAEPASATCNNGFEYFANAQNDIRLDLFGAKTIPLSHYDSPPLLQGCKLLDGSSGSTGSGSTGTGSTSSGSTGSGSIETGSDGSDKTGAGSSGSANTNPGSSGFGSTGSGDEDKDGSTTAPATGSGSGSTGSNEPATGGSDDETPTTGSDDKTPSAGSDDKTPSTGSDADQPDQEAKLKRFMPRQTTTGKTTIADDGETDFGSNPADKSADSDDSTPDDGGASDRSNADKAADAAASSSNSGFTYATITEIHNAFALIPGDDGNLYAGDASTGAANGTGLWGTYDGVAAMDDGNRVLHYYPDTMAAYNVSRIRLSDEDAIPKAADFIVLQPINADGDGSTRDLLFAVDTKGNAFGLVLCDFGNGADSKLFIVADGKGIDTLMMEKLRYTVTGAPVEQCDPVALVLGKTS